MHAPCLQRGPRDGVNKFVQQRSLVHAHAAHHVFAMHPHRHADLAFVVHLKLGVGPRPIHGRRRERSDVRYLEVELHPLLLQLRHALAYAAGNLCLVRRVVFSQETR